MSQIVFAYILENCLFFSYVVLTVTVRHEFNDVGCYVFVWLLILTYFLVYVRTGYNFVIQFRDLVIVCEEYLKEDRIVYTSDKNGTRVRYAEKRSIMLSFVPSVTMFCLAEVVSLAQWTGNCYFYIHLLVINGFIFFYHTLKLSAYHRRPS